MPKISLFYGIVISIFYKDNKQHHEPHIHVAYQEHKAVFRIPDGQLLEGSLPASRMKLVLAWIEIHQDDLMANWNLAVNGEEPFRIDPLK